MTRLTAAAPVRRWRQGLWRMVWMSLCLSTATVLAQNAALEQAWPNTDFSRQSVPMEEVMSGGPPKDGIPALTEPDFVAASAKTGLQAREAVVVFVPDSSPARAYPIRYLIWHEIVNDRVEGQPLLVTYCPLCNTAMIFDPHIEGRALSFGVSGLLRHADMIMYDHQSESWWQQALGEAIVGEMTGQALTQLPAQMLSWQGFLRDYPDGVVMAEPNWPRDYGSTPYQRYDSAERPFLYRGKAPPHGIAPLARVVRVGNRAWPLTRLREAGELREAGLVLRWQTGQASALDTKQIGQGRDVGTVRVQTADGEAVVYDMPFAFAFHAFHPEGRWMLGASP